MDTVHVFSERLKKLVDEKKENDNISQKQIAMEMGVSAGALSNYLAASAEPKIVFCAVASGYFGVSTDWLLGLSDVRKPDSELKGVCEYTGLKAEVVTALHEAKHPEDEDGARAIKQAGVNLANEVLPALFGAALFEYNIIESARKMQSTFEDYNFYLQQEVIEYTAKIGVIPLPPEDAIVYYAKMIGDTVVRALISYDDQAFSASADILARKVIDVMKDTESFGKTK